MNFWMAILEEAREGRTALLVGLAALALGGARLMGSYERVRLRGLSAFLGLHLLLLPVAAALRATGSTHHRDVELPFLLLGAVAGVMAAALLLFSVLLPRLRLAPPRILQDVLVAVTALVATFAVASRTGLNLSGIIATSAVLTAIIGFSLQDALANIMGGLALQLDQSVQVGDWVKVGDVNGRVAELRWRYTAVETRNWETVLVPNSLLMKQQVVVFGRRGGEEVPLRRWVYFNVDFRYPPSDVIEVVTAALRVAHIERVAADPPPNCVLMDLHESYARYAVRYWLTDLAVDDPTDSQVRTHVYFALKRAGIPLSIPAHALFVTEESHDREERKVRRERRARLEALERVELFSALAPEEREVLADSLTPAPFTRGDVLTRQGAEGHWLYLVTEGEVSVRVVGEGGLEREAGRIRAPGFFGEMSLMTGEPRSATVVALTDVECFRLDREAFRRVLAARPALAEELAQTLAARRAGLLAAREDLSAEAAQRRVEAEADDLLGRICSFFGLTEPRGRAAG